MLKYYISESMNGVFFSIIVPVYNVEKYLRECLDSILAQSYQKYELICINDASQDNSLNILNEYAGKNGNMQVIDNSVNKGQAHARNCGMKVAKGDYFVFVDADDILKADALEILEGSVRETVADIVYYNMDIRNEGNWAKEKETAESEPNFREYPGVYKGEELFVKQYWDHEMKAEVWRQAFSRNFLAKNNLSFYEGICHEDTLFSVLCAIKAERVIDIHKSLYIYRRRDQSVMSTMNLNRIHTNFIIFSELWDYWKNHRCSKEMDAVLEDFLYKTYQYFLSLKAYFPEDRQLLCGTPADQFMYRLLSNISRDEITHVRFSEEQLRRMKCAGKVFVYGAGTAGVETVRYLLSQGIKPQRVVVTNKSINADQIMGISIVQIDEIQIDREAVVIIAVLPNNQKAISDIRANLQKIGVENILQIEERLE